jgi:hypothetical protein
MRAHMIRRPLTERRPRRVLLVLAAALALALAACGGDDDETAAGTAAEDAAATEAAALQEEIADLSDEEQIERVGAAWAELFAGGDEAMCEWLHPDIAGGCSQFIQGGLTGSVELQQSYAGTTVESVEVKGRTAVAEFSNGERVKFEKDSNDEWKVTRTPRA